MIRIQRKQFSQVGVTIGSDRVIALMPIAPGGSFLSVSGEMHVIQHEVPHYDTTFVPARCYAVQTETKDIIANNWDVLWDRYIPKDDDISESANTYQTDISTTAADEAPFEEPGEPSPNELFGIKEPAKMLWRRDSLISMANNPQGYDASANTYSASRVYAINVRRRIQFPLGGFVAIGFAAPTFDDVVDATPNGIDTVQDLLMYANMPDFLHTARLALIGATESNAESPFVDVLGLIEQLVEPNVYEDLGDFKAQDYRVASRIVFNVGVPENTDTKVLKSD